MNETYYIKLTGKVNVPEKVEINQNFKVEIDGSITSETKEDNQDGTYSVISKFEPVLVTGISHTGERIKAKDPRKHSQKLRAVLHAIHAQNDDGRLPEEAYEQTMRWAIMNANDIYEQARDYYHRS